MSQRSLRLPFRLTGAALAAALAAGSPASAFAQAVGASRFYKAVTHGGTVEITTFSSVDPLCHSLGLPSINLLRAPQGGEVETGRGADFPNFPAGNIRSACNRKRIAGTRLLYKAGESFSGIDSFDVEVQYPDGYARKYRYAVVVN